MSAFSDAFNAFFDAFVEQEPIAATAIGDHRHDARWPDLSEAGRRERLAFVDAPRTVEEYRTIAERCSAPCLANMSETGRSPSIATDQLEEMGYKLVIFPSTQTWLFAKAYEELCQAVVRERTTASLADRFTSFDDVNALLGLAEWQSR